MIAEAQRRCNIAATSRYHPLTSCTSRNSQSTPFDSLLLSILTPRLINWNSTEIVLNVIESNLILTIKPTTHGPYNNKCCKFSTEKHCSTMLSWLTAISDGLWALQNHRQLTQKPKNIMPPMPTSEAKTKNETVSSKCRTLNLSEFVCTSCLTTEDTK